MGCSGSAARVVIMVITSNKDEVAIKRNGESMAALGAIVNEVIVGGRISGAPEERELPSGDTVVQLRLVVPRSSPRAGVGGGGATVDTIDVACWTKALQRKAVRLKPGDLVMVSGRFAGGSGVHRQDRPSRYEVEATALDRGVGPPPST